MYDAYQKGDVICGNGETCLFLDQPMMFECVCYEGWYFKQVTLILK